MKIGTPLPISSSSRLDSSALGEAAVTLLKVKDGDKCTAEYCDVASGKRLYSIQVSYQGTTGEVSYGPYDWTLIDSEGQQYSDSFYEDVALGQQLNSGDVGAKRTVKGVVSFEIPKDIKIVTVDFSNIGDWKVG